MSYAFGIKFILNVAVEIVEFAIIFYADML